MTSPSGSPPSTPALLSDSDDEAARRIVSRGPTGAYAVAGVASALVIAIYFGFYVCAYLPRGVLH